MALKVLGIKITFYTFWNILLKWLMNEYISLYSWTCGHYSQVYTCDQYVMFNVYLQNVPASSKLIPINAASWTHNGAKTLQKIAQRSRRFLIHLYEPCRRFHSFHNPCCFFCLWVKNKGGVVQPEWKKNKVFCIFYTIKCLLTIHLLLLLPMLGKSKEDKSLYHKLSGSWTLGWAALLLGKCNSLLDK